jgi:hypothetical protein
VTQEQYEQVSKQVMPSTGMPAGLRSHIAGPTENGWCVVEVWESQDELQRFFETTLKPALEQAGIDMNEPAAAMFRVHESRQA